MIESNFIQDISALKKLPKSWSILDFGTVFTDISGGNKKIYKSDFLVEGKVAIVDQGKDLIAGYTDEEDEVVKGQPPYIVFGDHTRIFKFIDFPFVMGADGTKVFKVKDISINNERYLFHFLNSLNIPNTGYNRHFKYLKSTKIPLPPLPQQQKIANILDATDALRQNNKALIAKYDELTQGLFLDMFGDPVSNPKGWEKRKLNEFLDVLVDVGSNGGNDWVSANIKMKDDENYALMIRTVNLNNNDFKKNLKFVSEETYNLFKKTKVYGGEIIMNKIGSAGEFWLMPNLNRPVSLGLNQLMMKFNNLEKIFFYYYFSTNYGKKLINSKLNGAITKSITKTALRDLDILYPPINIQNLFAKRVALIIEQKAIAKKNLAKSEELFNSLLQKAFKGELV